MKKSPILLGLYQALALGVYIGLVVTFMQNAQYLFEGSNVPEYAIAGMMITLFVTSALISGFIVFWQPFLLWNKKKTDQAVRAVGYTAVWLVAMLLGLIWFNFSL